MSIKSRVKLLCNLHYLGYKFNQIFTSNQTKKQLLILKLRLLTKNTIVALTMLNKKTHCNQIIKFEKAGFFI